MIQNINSDTHEEPPYQSGFALYRIPDRKINQRISAPDLLIGFFPNFQIVRSTGQIPAAIQTRPERIVRDLEIAYRF